MKVFYSVLLSFFLALPVFAEDNGIVIAESNNDDIEATMSFEMGGPDNGKKSEVEVKDNEDEDYLLEEEGVYSNVTDPLEGYNRAMFEFNNLIYNGLLEPVATVYGEVLPYGLRLTISNFFHNLAMPVHFISSNMQGEEEKSGQVLQRFVINTTLGVGGLFDVAEETFGIPKVTEDMEQALTKNTDDPGPYIVWPIIGPSTATGTVGTILDGLLNPAFWLVGDFWSGTAITGEKMVNELSFNPDVRSKVQEGALDPYLATQDAYLQYRENKLKE